VAAVLQRQGLATLLFDWLTREEEREDRQNAQLRFDIGLLATQRVIQLVLSGVPLQAGSRGSLLTKALHSYFASDAGVYTNRHSGFVLKA
jgi:hypothetical protein